MYRSIQSHIIPCQAGRMRLSWLTTLVLAVAVYAGAFPHATGHRGGAEEFPRLVGRRLLGRQRRTFEDGPEKGACDNELYLAGVAGYGEKVGLSFKGGVLVAGAEANTTNQSGAYVSLFSGSGCTFDPPIALEAPPGVNTSVTEFGTQVKVSADGKVVLVVADQMEFNLSGGSKRVDLGYIYKLNVAKMRYRLVATLGMDVTLEAQEGYNIYNINDATGALSDDGKTAAVTFIGQLKYEDPNVPDANATAQVDLPGVIKVFTGRNYELFSTIGAPPEVYEAAGVGLNVTFGRNIAISGDGQLIAVSDDQTAAVYVYQRYRRGYRQEQVIPNAIPVVNNETRGQLEHLMLSYHGEYLSYVYGNYQAAEDNSTDPLQDAGGIRMYVRGFAADSAHNDQPPPIPDGAYVLSCDLFPIKNLTGQPVKDADGGAMADMDGVQRVVGGFAGYGAIVYDFKHSDLARGRCPKKPVAQLVYPPTGRKVNRDDISEAVDISGDGLLVAQGWSTYNENTGAVILNSLLYPDEYNKKYGN